MKAALGLLPRAPSNAAVGAVVGSLALTRTTNTLPVTRTVVWARVALAALPDKALLAEASAEAG